MGYEATENIIVELTEDGMFMAYIPGMATSYALGETEDEARDNLLDRYAFDPDNWGDADEYSYLRCGLN